MSNIVTSTVGASLDAVTHSPLHLVADEAPSSSPAKSHDARQRLEEKLADLALEKDVREFDFDI